MHVVVVIKQSSRATAEAIIDALPPTNTEPNRET